MSIKIVVVDDSALYRQLVKNVLRSIPEVEIIGFASSGKQALEKIAELKPDLLTLDVQMPDMNGLEVLQEINKLRLPVKAIMLSSLTAHGAQVTTDALLAGAFDFIQKPSGPDANLNRIQLEGLLSEKLKAFLESCNASMPKRNADAAIPTTTEPHSSISSLERSASGSDQGPQYPTKTNRINAVVIGTSTGGPMALREVIPRLPATLGVPVFVVQHMPPNYTQSLAARIGEQSKLHVEEAADGTKVAHNHVYIAPGGKHLGLDFGKGYAVIQTSLDPPEHNCRPAVDYTLRAVANAYAGKVLGVILTGMGRDGTEGCRLIKQMGGFVLAQHPEGCIVYGMPKVVVEEQLVDRVVPIEKMAGWITRMVEKSRVNP